MFTYSFSLREKILLTVLLLVGVVVLWYNFVFVPIQNQRLSLDSQIAAAQDEFTAAQTRTASLSSMREVVEQYQAQGIQPVLLPNYDNTQNLMAYLNGVLGGTQGYSMSFDKPSLSEEDGTVHRSGTITFTSASYEDARSVIQAIAKGPYPCQIDALGITDGNVSGSQGSGGVVNANLQVTFFENPTTNLNSSSSSSGEVKGQDLSKMSDWNK